MTLKYGDHLGRPARSLEVKSFHQLFTEGKIRETHFSLCGEETVIHPLNSPWGPWGKKFQKL
jgi:hypothetical protein